MRQEQGQNIRSHTKIFNKLIAIICRAELHGKETTIIILLLWNIDKSRPLCNSHPVRLLARFVRSLAVHLLEQPNKSLDLPEITKLDEVKNMLTKIVKFRYIKKRHLHKIHLNKIAEVQLLNDSQFKQYYQNRDSNIFCQHKA